MAVAVCNNRSYSMRRNMLNTDAASDADVIIVGGGMGGCAAAYEFCRRGLRVLLLEKGKSQQTNTSPDSAVM